MRCNLDKMKNMQECMSPPAKKQKTKRKNKMTPITKVATRTMMAFLDCQEKHEEKLVNFEPMGVKEEREHKGCMTRLILASQQRHAFHSMKILSLFTLIMGNQVETMTFKGIHLVVIIRCFHLLHWYSMYFAALYSLQSGSLSTAVFVVLCTVFYFVAYQFGANSLNIEIQNIN